jgi:hypothetical protein
MQQKTLAQSIRHGFFSERNSMEEAMQYAYSIAQASDSPIHVMTAIHVVLNTLANEMEKEAA